MNQLIMSDIYLTPNSSSTSDIDLNPFSLTLPTNPNTQNWLRRLPPTIVHYRCAQDCYDTNILANHLMEFIYEDEDMLDINCSLIITSANLLSSGLFSLNLSYYDPDPNVNTRILELFASLGLFITRDRTYNTSRVITFE